MPEHSVLVSGTQKHLSLRQREIVDTQRHRNVIYKKCMFINHIPVSLFTYCLSVSHGEMLHDTELMLLTDWLKHRLRNG